MQLKQITIENFQDLTLEMLSNSDYFPQIEQIIYDAEAGGSPDEARDVLTHLYSLIEKSANREALATKYLHCLVALRLISLIRFRDEEKRRFLSENLKSLFSQDIADVFHWIRFLYAYYDYHKDVCEPINHKFIEAVENSLDLIGSKDIYIDNKSVKPFIKNWIYDYRAFKTPVAKRGATEQTLYINQSANVRSLNPQERDLLRRILKFYDWLRFEALNPTLPEEYQVLHTYPSLQPEAELGISKPSNVVLPLSKPFVSATPKPPTPPKPPAPPQGASIDNLKHEILDSGPIFPVKPAKPPVTQAPNPLAQEIKREVTTPELPSHKIPAQPPTPAPKPPGLEFNSLEDLKKIEVSYLRKGPLPQQINLIKSQISHLALLNHLLPYHAVVAFEQSPLFKTYLSVGAKNIVNKNTNSIPSYEPLTLQEFEAMADLRKEIEKL